MMKRLYTILFFLSVVVATPLAAAKELPSAHELIRGARQACFEHKWKQADYLSSLVLEHYPTTSFATDALYFRGLANYEQAHFKRANAFLDKYVNDDNGQKYYDDAMIIKFQIGKTIVDGRRVHIFGQPKLPRFSNGRDFALALFDEVIMSAPRHECAAQSLFYKGKLLAELGEFKESIESFETMIRRFPKHAHTPDCFLEIGRVYIARCADEFADSDFYELAKINVRKFKAQFPSDPKVRVAELQLKEIQEALSRDLFEIAQFYERTNKKQAAQIYYSSIVNRYPETEVAQKSQHRLNKMGLSVVHKGVSLPKNEEIREQLITEK